METCSFQPLLFGGDINVYSVARAFHEAYSPLPSPAPSPPSSTTAPAWRMKTLTPF